MGVSKITVDGDCSHDIKRRFLLGRKAMTNLDSILKSRDIQFSSVQSRCCIWLFVIPWAAVCRLPCPSPSPGVCSSSCPLSRWCHPTISASVAPFSFCLQFFPASGSFLMSQLFISGSQNIGTSASASVLPMNIQGWFPLGLTSLISLLSNRLSRVFSNTTVWKHQLFGTQPSSWSNSQIPTWLLEKP